MIMLTMISTPLGRHAFLPLIIIGRSHACDNTVISRMIPGKGAATALGIRSPFS